MKDILCLYNAILSPQMEKTVILQMLWIKQK